jgi:hypothetical protein
MIVGYNPEARHMNYSYPASPPPALPANSRARYLFPGTGKRRVDVHGNVISYRFAEERDSSEKVKWDNLVSSF